MISIIVSYTSESKNDRISINSAINQTYRDIEVIVVGNDELSEKALQTTLRFQEEFSNLKFISDPKALSSIDAFCRGAYEAQGEYIIFLSNEDYLAPNYVSTMIKGMKNSDSEIGFSSFKIFKKGKEYSGANYKEGKVIGNKKYLSDSISVFRLWNTIVKKDFFLELLKNEDDLKEFHSITTTVALISKATSCYCSCETLYYRGASFVRHYAEELHLTLDSVLKCKMFDLPKSVYNTILIDELLIRLSISIYKHYLSNKDQELLKQLSKIRQVIYQEIGKPKWFIFFMNRPIFYKKAAISILNGKYVTKL